MDSSIVCRSLITPDTLCYVEVKIYQDIQIDELKNLFKL
jgi:hypothetical protein